MIKTLRITSVMAAILAAVFFVFPAVFGVRSDEQVEGFLDSAGAIEEFKSDRGEKSAKSERQISPLVEQAKDFALYLNPPPAPKPKRTAKPRKPSVSPKPRTVSPKFTLVGTSYYASHPELSLALIDEPGKDLRWVSQSSKVGHLVIEEVKDGVVVVRDGQRTFELVAKRPEKRSLVKSPPSGETGSKSTLTALDKTGARITGGESAPARRDVEEEAASARRRLRRGSRSGETGSKAKSTPMSLVKPGAKIARSKAPQVSAEKEKEVARAKKISAEPEAVQPGFDKTDVEYSEEEKAVLAEEMARAEKIFAELEAMQSGSDKAGSEYSAEEDAAFEGLIKRLEAMHSGSDKTDSERSFEESAVFDELISKLKAVQSGSDKTDSERSSEESEALIEKIISDFAATRIGAEEAKRLDRLGKELKDILRDLNQAKDSGDEAEASSREPNSSAKK